ncbi:hypothetical protein [Xenorhabdus bovienii]|nr:hypothetical protein [Xenorhabdus bovienii]MDE9538162.1 hypothetical protein [Xenorhabdus bovienii]
MGKNQLHRCANHITARYLINVVGELVGGVGCEEDSGSGMKPVNPQKVAG